MTRPVAVIQARTGSNRLPGKVLEPIEGETSLLAYQCRRLRHIPGIDELVIATTESSADDAVASLAEAEGIGVVRGSEEDVLSRFLRVADETGATTLVRITGDSPFRDPAVVAKCLVEHREHTADYTRPADGHLPKGLRAEVVETAVLRRIAQDPDTTSRDREHVTVRIRENMAAYRVHLVGFPANLHHPEVDLSVDHPDDLATARSVLAELNARNWPVDTVHICRLMDEKRGPNASLESLAS
ncbi:MAG: hypothetical protein VX529_11355 [Pseudomonadota bacterium]|nr:hypothetical protein [Pseudomonadota bacterium]